MGNYRLGKQRRVTITFIYVCVHSRSHEVLNLKENTVKTIVMVQCFAPDCDVRRPSIGKSYVQIFSFPLSSEKS